MTQKIENIEDMYCALVISKKNCDDIRILWLGIKI